jgi:hypothetical protein
MVNGILQGTQTWQQAMGRLFSNLAIKFADDVVLKMVTDWAKGLAEKVSLTQAFNAVMAALGLEQASTATATQTASDAAIHSGHRHPDWRPLLKNNAGVITQTIASQVRNGNSRLRMS